MKSRSFGPRGQQVPMVGQGTWQMERARAASIRALQAGIDAGLCHIDTAEMYGSGAVERLVGEALVGRRDEVFLVSKVLPSHASVEGTVEACERSLTALRTDRLDCYLLHWPGAIPFEETLSAFETLERAGKILSFGVSNFDVDELARAVQLAGEGAIACNQVLYHLRQRYIEHELLPWCGRHDIAVVAYSPFGSGRFPPPTSSGGRLLGSIAERHQATAHQVALAYLLREENVLVIPKSRSVEHALDNGRAAELSLGADELEAIDAAFPAERGGALPVL